MTWQPFLPYNAILCRYNEIATKGRNRTLFESALADSLKRNLAHAGPIKVINEHGRLFVIPAQPKETFTPEDIQLFRDIIPTVPGISSVSPGFMLQPTLEDIENAFDKWFSSVMDAFRAQKPMPQPTYAMRARRANKQFHLTAEEIEKHFATKVLAQNPDLKIDLKNANLVVEVEIRFNRAFLSFERIQGAGGLPAGSGGHVLALLSGGIDSPAACFLMMKRGCTVDFVTFHSEPYTPPEYIDKIVAIARKLNTYQKRGRLAAVNLLDAQLEIRDKCKSKYRTVLYRRFMLRIASQIARIFGAKALVTGDNLGQVASQTLDNMATIEDASDMMILRPLLTADKLDAIAIAEKIGTFDLSSVPIPDSCTVFAPDDPATSTRAYHVKNDEENLNIEELVQKCLKNTIVINPKTDKRHPLEDLTTNKTFVPQGT